jgi:hypothetical protein
MVAPMPIVESWNSPMEPLELAAAGVRAGLRRQLGDRLPAQRLLGEVRPHPGRRPEAHDAYTGRKPVYAVGAGEDRADTRKDATVRVPVGRDDHAQ